MRGSHDYVDVAIAKVVNNFLIAGDSESKQRYMTMHDTKILF